MPTPCSGSLATLGRSLPLRMWAFDVRGDDRGRARDTSRRTAMSVRSMILATVAWGMVVILPLASCSAVTGSGGPSGPAGPSGSRVSAKPSSARVPTTTPSQSTLPVNFDGLPAPQACDPATPKLAPLNQLDRKTIDNPYVPGGGGQFITVDLGNGVTLPIK